MNVYIEHISAYLLLCNYSQPSATNKRGKRKSYRRDLTEELCISVRWKGQRFTLDYYFHIFRISQYPTE